MIKKGLQFDRRVLGISVLLMAVAACSVRSPVGASAPSVPLATEFPLRPGEWARVEGTALQLRFDRVVSDSRCPADVVCVWAGDAVIALAAREASAPERSYELHTDGAAPSEVSHGAYRIRLLRLEPRPLSSSPIAAQSYRAVLLVSRG